MVGVLAIAPSTLLLLALCHDRWVVHRDFACYAEEHVDENVDSPRCHIAAGKFGPRSTRAFFLPRLTQHGLFDGGLAVQIHLDRAALCMLPLFLVTVVEGARRRRIAPLGVVGVGLVALFLLSSTRGPLIAYAPLIELRFLGFAFLSGWTWTCALKSASMERC